MMANTLMDTIRSLAPSPQLYLTCSRVHTACQLCRLKHRCLKSSAGYMREARSNLCLPGAASEVACLALVIQLTDELDLLLTRTCVHLHATHRLLHGRNVPYVEGVSYMSMHDCVAMHNSPALDLCPRHWHCSCQANTRPQSSCCHLACALCETAAHAACNRLHTSTNPLPGRNTAPLHMKQTSAPDRMVAKAKTDPDIALRHDSLRSSSSSDGVDCCFVSFK
jgi:hypothetical protein